MHEPAFRRCSDQLEVLEGITPRRDQQLLTNAIGDPEVRRSLAATLDLPQDDANSCFSSKGDRNLDSLVAGEHRCCYAFREELDQLSSISPSTTALPIWS